MEIADSLPLSTIRATRPQRAISSAVTKPHTTGDRPRPRAAGAVATPARKPTSGALQASAATLSNSLPSATPAQARTPGWPGQAYESGAATSSSAVTRSSLPSQRTGPAVSGVVSQSIQPNDATNSTPGTRSASSRTTASSPNGRYDVPTSASTCATSGARSSTGPRTASRSRREMSGAATATASPSRHARDRRSPCAAHITSGSSALMRASSVTSWTSRTTPAGAGAISECSDTTHSFPDRTTSRALLRGFRALDGVRLEVGVAADRDPPQSPYDEVRVAVEAQAELAVGEHPTGSGLRGEPGRQVHHRAVDVAEPDQDAAVREADPQLRHVADAFGLLLQGERDLGAAGRLVGDEQHLVADRLDQPAAVRGDHLGGHRLETFDQLGQLGLGQPPAQPRVADDVGEPDHADAMGHVAGRGDRATRGGGEVPAPDVRLHALHRGQQQ